MCPNGCCPNGCCPNGLCGVQFQGCCSTFDTSTVVVAPTIPLQDTLLSLLKSNMTQDAVLQAANGAAKATKDVLDKDRQKTLDLESKDEKDWIVKMKMIDDLTRLEEAGKITADIAKAKKMKILDVSGMDVNAAAAEPGEQKEIRYPLGGCCNYAPCCFPNSICPNSCCPNSCCPNGCIGTQSKGCCLSVKGMPPWELKENHERRQLAFLGQVQAILDSEAPADSVIAALRELVQAPAPYQLTDM